MVIVKFVDLPINSMVIFHPFLCVYQRVVPSLRTGSGPCSSIIKPVEMMTRPVRKVSDYWRMYDYIWLAAFKTVKFLMHLSIYV